MSWSDPNAIRAQQQSVGEQLGNMALRAPVNIALGTISNIAASLDIEDYFNMDDEVGNPISNLMNEWQESIRQSNPIYRERPGSTFDVRDSGWWIDNASMLLESAGAFVGSGALTGAAVSRVLGAISSGILSAANSGKLAKKTAEALLAIEKTGKAITPELAALTQAEQKAKLIGQMSAIPSTIVTAIANNQAESVMESSQVFSDVYLS